MGDRQKWREIYLVVRNPILTTEQFHLYNTSSPEASRLLLSVVTFRWEQVQLLL